MRINTALNDGAGYAALPHTPRAPGYAPQRIRPLAARYFVQTSRNVRTKYAGGAYFIATRPPNPIVSPPP